MTPVDLAALFRAEVQDTAQPYLWTESEVYTYMTDAQEMFCRLGAGIADSTSKVCTLFANAGDPWTDISPRILKIRRASRDGDSQQLDILNFEDFDKPSMTNDYGRTVTVKLNTDQGTVQALIEGMEQDKVRWYMVPAVNTQIDLIVYRLPLLCTLDENSEFELQDHQHLNLLHWMKYRAYCKQDAEAFDRSKAEEFKAKFMEACDLAKREREKREHKPRSMVYGGI